VHGNAVIAQHPELAALRIQLQIAHAGTLRIVCLGERRRRAATENEGLHFPLSAIGDEKQMLLRPLKDGLKRQCAISRLTAGKQKQEGKE